jgi:hypothetical protein
MDGQFDFSYNPYEVDSISGGNADKVANNIPDLAVRYPCANNTSFGHDDFENDISYDRDDFENDPDSYVTGKAVNNNFDDIKNPSDSINNLGANLFDLHINHDPAVHYSGGKTQVDYLSSDDDSDEDTTPLRDDPYNDVVNGGISQSTDLEKNFEIKNFRDEILYGGSHYELDSMKNKIFVSDDSPYMKTDDPDISPFLETSQKINADDNQNAQDLDTTKHLLQQFVKQISL